MLLVSTTETAMKTGSGGIDSCTSAMRMRTASTQPPNSPLTTPTVQPTTTDRLTTPSATSNEVLMPPPTQASTSRPRASVPSRCPPAPGPTRPAVRS